MAPTYTALTTKVESGSPYQLNHEQVLKASTALLKHMKTTLPESSKQSLLPTTTDEENTSESTPIWLTLTTKTHIVPKLRLKPSKITLPHPLLLSSTSTICLIVADPQRTYKDLIASPSFPTSLSSRITKVVGISKIKAKWTQYEAQRKLFAEHDIFLADDRIITLLPKLLGKTFYKSTTKRPIPISLAASPIKVDGKKTKAATPAEKAATAPQIAAQIEKALSSTLVNLSPSTQTSIKIGYSHWEAAKLVENIETVVNEAVGKFVVKGWRGVKGLHIKGPETAALPIWLADELWVDEEDVLSKETIESKEVKANEGRKRKKVLEGAEEKAEEGGKKKKSKTLKESNDDKLDLEIAARKKLLKKQKEEAGKGGGDEVPKGTKVKETKKKGKKAVVA